MNLFLDIMEYWVKYWTGVDACIQLINFPMSENLPAWKQALYVEWQRLIILSCVFTIFELSLHVIVKHAVLIEYHVTLSPVFTNFQSTTGHIFQAEDAWFSEAL